MMNGETSPCTWKSVRGSKPGVCNKELNTGLKQHLHKRGHIKAIIEARRKATEFICRFDECAESGTKWTPSNLYLAMSGCVHEIPYMVGPVGLFFFCDFGEDSIWDNERTTEHVEHMTKHLDTALQNVHVVGYNGVFLKHRAMSPGHCIFCIHQPDLHILNRIRVFNYNAEPESHMWEEHVSKLEGLSHCPTSAAAGAQPVFCTSTRMMSKEDFLEHLASEHCVDAPSSKPETRDTRAKKTASVLGDDAAENSTKKGKTRKPSNKKEAPSSSETTKPNTKSPAHKSTIRIKYESEDEDDEESVGLPAGRTGRKSTRRIVGSEDDDDDESVGLSLGGIRRTVLEDKPTKTKSSKRAKSTASKSIGP